MPISIFGINHKTAPVEIREKVAFSPDTICSQLAALQQQAGLFEVAIISTCNRMEVVFRAFEKPEEKLPYEQSHQRVIKWLADCHSLRAEDIAAYGYQHNGDDAVRHLMAVACGLDSMVLGEPQILGQVKDAYGYAKQAGTLGTHLDKLFTQTFSVAKKVRSDTQIGESAVSVAYAAVSLSKRIFSDFSQIKALFIGAGETIELAARHLQRQGVKHFDVANRTVQRAQALADEFGGRAFGLGALPELIPDADIIITSTASPVAIIGKGMVESARKKRKQRPLFIVDLAVPRDVEPQVAELNDVYLYTVDDMQDVINENLKAREQAAEEARDIIENFREKYRQWLHALASVDLLKQYREKFEQIKKDELNRALSKLQNGEEPGAVMNELANRLAQKLMHGPTRMLRQAGENKDNQALNLLARTFGLDDPI